ncbi:hypothetical protein Patl1_10144 [Pistacia atlantica]|uniref:Uncharacterized protein n=1 Tax=Pistacia atlantica TaxID=434234 RepID=A0ACC1A7Y3_9ROSI|nr:hypothetical protein Patl1_10144 [Pistacia atlantica]
MMNLLSVLQMDRFAPRFYIAAATDNMSLQKSRVFEDSLVHKNLVKGSSAQFMQIYRSREVGQSYISSVWTTLLAIAHALWLMIRIRPQVVLCNGPGTCIPLCIKAEVMVLRVPDFTVSSLPAGHENIWTFLQPELPKHMRRLKNLRHFYLSSLIAELKGLNLLGKLHIKHLDRVSNPMHAKEANLSGKQSLHSLYLSWELDNEIEQQENAERVLETLEPNPHLEILVIEDYKGTKFSLWMRELILRNVVSINLTRCRNCCQLPLLGQLPCLRYLTIIGMTHVLYIDHSLQDGVMMRRFPCLKNLDLRDLPSLQRLSREDGRELLPCLTRFKYNQLPKVELAMSSFSERLESEGL